MLPIRTLLLLIALLPGLLLPAGTALRRCGCSGIVRVVHRGFGPACAGPRATPDGVSTGCCASVAVRAPARACCAPADVDGARVRAVDDDPCRCATATESESPPRLPPGDPHRVPLPAVAPVFPSFALPAPVIGAAPQTFRTRAPPDPGARRNLPLLL